jgi:drug/metabolite transporter (DMT)-like permease
VGPKLSGNLGPYALLSLSSAPVFACSFLLTKVLTRHDRTDVIVVWQALTISMMALPLACLHWSWPSPSQWAWFALCGCLGSIGHYCLTSSFKLADMSATQSIKFLDLVWATMIGFVFFGDRVSTTTMIGGVVILIATIAISRWEATQRRRADPPIGDEREL